MTIDFDKIVNHLGQPEKTANGHSYWQCPYCVDSGKDNIVYTHKNGLFTCFANSDHSRQILSDMAKNMPTATPAKNIPKDIKEPVPDKKPSITDDYLLDCVIELQNDKQAQDFIRKHRGLEGGTLELFGIDKKNKRWVFPAFDINTGEFFGAEYRTNYMIMPKHLRPANHKGLTKAPGTTSKICSVFAAGITYENGQRIDPLAGKKKLIVCEGFIDSYTLFQLLVEAGEAYTYDIATPSNGVGTIKGLLHTIPQKYTEIIFWLDSDEAGDQARKDIKKLAKFDFFLKKNDCTCCKDINEWYMKHIKRS